MTQPDDIQPDADRRLLEQYRATAAELPPPALDRRILDAARVAAGEPGVVAGNAPAFAADREDAPRPRRDDQRWMRPLALAAIVVLGVGIVLRVQMESPDFKPPVSVAEVAKPAPAAPAATSAADQAPAKVEAPVAAAAPAQPAAPPASAPAATGASANSAPAARTDASALAGAAGGSASADARQGASAARQEKKAAAPEARSARTDPVREGLAKEESSKRLQEQAAAELLKLQAPKAKDAGPAGNLTAGVPAASPAADSAADKLSNQPSLATKPAAPVAQATPAAPPPVASAAPGSANQGDLMQGAAAPAARRDAAESSRARVAVAPFYEGDPDLWARRIIEWRRAGQTAQADADLKRLRARYPDFKLPPETLPQ